MDASDFPRIQRLPPYVFNIVGDLKLKEAKVAVSPGVGFGEYGDKYVRFALIENEHRTRQALRGIRRALEEASGPALRCAG